jgi:hypothetical protein
MRRTFFSRAPIFESRQPHGELRRPAGSIFSPFDRFHAQFTPGHRSGSWLPARVRHPTRKSVRVINGGNAMFKMILIGTTLAALVLTGTASAQEQAAVQLPDVQAVGRLQELARQRTEHRDYYNYYDAWGTPIAVAESKLLAERAFVPATVAADPRPLAEGEAQIP